MSVVSAFRRVSRRSFLPSRLAYVAQKPMLVRLGLRYTSSVNDGTVSTDRGWSDRERAAEGRYAHDVELEQLRALRRKLEVQERDLESDMEKLDQEIAVRENSLAQMNKKQDS